MQLDEVTITEADVMAFVKHKTEVARKEFPTLTELEAKAGPNHVSIYGYQGDNFVGGYGTTFFSAAADLRSRIVSPENIAAKKREEAAKLLAEAESLSPSTQNEKAPAL